MPDRPEAGWYSSDVHVFSFCWLSLLMWPKFILNRPEAGWYNAGYIFPDNFKSRVNFRSSVQLDQLVRILQKLQSLNSAQLHWEASGWTRQRLPEGQQPPECNGSCSGSLPI